MDNNNFDNNPYTTGSNPYDYNQPTGQSDMNTNSSTQNTNPYAQGNTYQQNTNPYQQNTNPYQQGNTYQQNAYNPAQYQVPINETYLGKLQEEAEREAKKGLAIWSMVLGIISLTICCCFGGVIPAVVGLILGIVSLAKKRGGKGMAIAGVIMNAIGLVWGIIMVIYFAAVAVVMADAVGTEGGMQEFLEAFEEEYYDEYGEYYEVDTLEEAFDIDLNLEHEDGTSENVLETLDHDWSEAYTLSDDSTIYFYSSGSFDWYLDEENSDDVKRGTFELYFGQDAWDYLVDTIPEYGITDEELEDYMERNEGDDFYNLDNLTVLVLNENFLYYDGELSTETYVAYYYGFSDAEYYDALSLGTGNYVEFTAQ